MATKFLSISLLLAVAMISTFSTCKKGITGCAETVYSFQMDIKAYPDIDSIHTGDTLWLEVNSPATLQDNISNRLVNYSGAENLGTAIGFGQFKNDSTTVAANFFDYKLVLGIPINNPNINQIREYLFIQTNNNYAFKLGIVPKYKGTFSIGVSNAANVYRKSDNCTKASFVITFKDTKQHYYLNPFIKSSNIDTLNPSGSYYFKVY